MKGLRATPYWIPACAGMTEEVPEKLLPKVWECLRITGKLRFDRATHIEGVQRGRAPLPRVWGCPRVSSSSP